MSMSYDTFIHKMIIVVGLGIIIFYSLRQFQRKLKLKYAIIVITTY